MGNLALRRLSAVLLLVGLLPLSGGCTLERVRVNRHLEAADTSWIVPGQTTFGEVIDRLGFPPPVERADDAPAWITPDALRYVSQDSFTARLQIGYILEPIFERTSVHAADDLQMFFDSNGIVSRISRIRTEDGELIITDYREVAP